jgi:hypothetical protein
MIFKGDEMFINWYLLGKEIKNNILRLLIVFDKDPEIQSGFQKAYPELFSETACEKISVATIKEAIKNYSVQDRASRNGDTLETLSEEVRQTVLDKVERWYTHYIFSFDYCLKWLHLPFLRFSIYEGVSIPEEIIDQIAGKTYGEPLFVTYNSVECIVTDWLAHNDEQIFDFGETMSKDTLRLVTKLHLLPLEIIDFSGTVTDQIVSDPGKLTEELIPTTESGPPLNWDTLSEVNNDLFKWLVLRTALAQDRCQENFLQIEHSRVILPEKFMQNLPDEAVKNRLKIGFPRLFELPCWADVIIDIPLSILKCAGTHTAIMSEWGKPHIFGNFYWLHWLYFLNYKNLLVEIAENVMEIPIKFISTSLKKELDDRICGEIIDFTWNEHNYLIVDYSTEEIKIFKLFGKPMKKCWRHLESITLLLNDDYVDLEK